MQNRWFHPPHLHSPAPGRERRVGWLELFYDLIYVALIIQLGNLLSEHVGWTGIAAFAGLFVPVWFTWTGFTFYSNRFVVDDFVHRALVFLQMFAIGGVAVSVSGLFRGEFFAFSCFYALARFVVVALYYRVYKHVPVARALARRYVIGFSVGALLWLSAAFIPWPWVLPVWGVAMLLDLNTVLSHVSRTLTAQHPPDTAHATERYGLLTIIVLGESFVKVLSAVSSDGLHRTTFLMCGCVLFICCSLWWIYFDDVAGSRIKAGRLTPFFWIYSHLPLTMAITAVGVAAKKAVFFEPNLVAPTKYRWFVCGTLAFALFWVAVIDSITERRQAELSDRTRVNTRFGASFFVLLLAPMGAVMPAWGFVGLVTAAMFLQVLIDLAMAPEADPEAAHHEHPALFRGETQVAASEPDKPSGSFTLRRRTAGDAVRRGTPNALRKDLYFYLMEGSWTRFFIVVVVAYFFINVVFAGLFLLEPASVSNLQTGSFLEAFAFSVQTMSTIGYGGMAPATPYGHALVTIEAFIGLMGVALATGLLFAKVSRPVSSVLFSKVLVVTTRHGRPNLHFRLGNARGNDITEASIRVSVAKDEVSPEGHRLRRLYDLKLERNTSPMFILSWSVFHVIDEESPLHGLTHQQLLEQDVSVIASMMGHDSTYAQSTHARHVYAPEDFRFGEHFVDVISRLDDGRLLVDYTHFHDTVADMAPSETPPTPAGETLASAEAEAESALNAASDGEPE